MHTVAAIAGTALLLIILWDAFETVVLPRRVTRQIRLTRLFFRSSWRSWAALAGRVRSDKRREALLGVYGPLSLLLLLAIWAFGLILGFACLHWSFGSAIETSGRPADFGTDLYFSGSSFFTLGLGDVAPPPRGLRLRAVAVAEAGMGFGFLALVIGYLPVIYQSFSRRESNIALLDARAGSPPTAGELLRRHSDEGGMEALQQLLHEWEHWSAELLESHISYPLLAYFRSQHKNQSWLGALTAILDATSFLIAYVDDSVRRQADLTFAMARHAVVDLAQIFDSAPRPPKHDRLPKAALADLHATLSHAGLRLRSDPDADQKLAKLRRLYEAYVSSLSEHLRLTLPPWIPESRRPDNWQTSAWEGRSSVAEVGPRSLDQDHF